MQLSKKTRNVNEKKSQKQNYTKRTCQYRFLVYHSTLHEYRTSPQTGGNDRQVSVSPFSQYHAQCD